MILLLFLLPIIFISSFYYGMKLFDFIGYRCRDPVYLIFYAALLGISLMCSLLLFLSTFGPIGGIGYLILFFGLIGALVSFNKYEFFAEYLKSHWIDMFLLLGLSAWHGTQYVQWPDTGNYHFPISQWMSNYGLVWGLGNGYFRWALLSSWFSFSAGLDAFDFSVRLSAVGNIFLTWLLLLWMSYSLSNFHHKSAKIIHKFYFFSFLIVVLMTWLRKHPFEWTHSLNPDFPIAIALIAMLGGLWDEWIDREGTVFDMPPLEYVGLLSGLVAAIKINFIIFGFLFGLSVIIFRRSGVSSFIKSSILLLVSSLPIVIANYKVSGCPFYPSSLFCSESKWAMGKEIVSNEALSMRLWNGWDGPPPPHANYWNWIPEWIDALNDDGFLVWPGLVFGIIGIWMAWRRWDLKLLICQSVGFLSVCFIFAMMPGIRLMTAPLAVLIAAFMAQFSWFTRYLPSVAKTRILFLFILAISNWLYLKKMHVFEYYTAALENGLEVDRPFSFLMPPRLINMQEGYKKVLFDTESKQGIVFVILKDSDRCWALPQPCVPITSTNILVCDEVLGIDSGFCRRQR